MPRAKRDVFTATSGYNEFVKKVPEGKPVAPADLWAKLNELTIKLNERPAGAFTQSEYSDKLGLSRSTGERRLAALVKKGAVTKLRQGLYQLVTE